MKKTCNLKNIFLFGLLTGLLTFTLSSYVIGQDTVKAKSKKSVIRLKIKKDDNGKTTVIDTTFTLGTPASHKLLKEYLNKREADLDELGEELDNIEIMVDIPDFPDSLATDSVIKQLRFVGKDIKSPRFRWHNKHEGFDYEFDVPCPPSCRGYEGFEREYWPDHDIRPFQYENKRQTLSDILGDIPMDRVKSYSIKDRKNGKRIIIDLNDGPMIEKQDRVIIIRDPGRSPRRGNH